MVDKEPMRLDDVVVEVVVDEAGAAQPFGRRQLRTIPGCGCSCASATRATAR